MTRTSENSYRSCENTRYHTGHNENTNNTEFHSHNEATSYIIDTNKLLLVENKNLEKKICELNEKLETLEDDIGRTEGINVKIKLILKNFQAISENSEKISKSRELIYKSYKEDFLDYINEIKFIRSLIILLGIGMIGYMYLCCLYGYIDLFTAIFTYIIMILQGFLINLCTSYKLKKYPKIEFEIKSYEKEILSIKETLYYINEYIDLI